MADFTAAEVEDGTGKSTALVFENIATITASGGWLDLRGYSSLSGGTEATQKAAMLKATDLVLAALGRFWRGKKTNADQAFLLPSAGAYRRDGTLLATDEIPEDFLAGWRLACEKQHADTLADPADWSAEAKRIAISGGVTVDYRDQAPDPILQDKEIWGLLRPILPPF